jgi:membrane protease YdiL (CAAX protease family)
MNPNNRLLSFVIIAILYIFAVVLGVVVYNALPFVPWLSLLIADLAATLFIWLASLLLHNASV